MLTTLTELYTEMSNLSTPTELTVVLNGRDVAVMRTLRKLAERWDRLQVYVTKYRVDRTTALLVGVENAIGDWVATIDLGSDHPTVIRTLFECALREQAEVVLSVSEAHDRPALEAVLSRLYHRVFRALYGFNLAREAPSARLLSRAVVNSLLCDDSPLIAFEILTAKGGYRRCSVPGARRKGDSQALGEKVRLRWRTLIGVDAAPLRLANLLCGVTAVGALSYSVYVVVIYLVKDNVVPGWTTLSLMLSGMFLMLALVLWLLSEYMLMLLDPGARRPRYEIAEEFCGQTRSSGGVLNVEAEL